MTAPTDERPEGPPLEQEWIPAPDPPPIEHRSEPDTSNEDRGRPVGQWVAGGASGLSGGGAALYHFAGPIGLAAGAVTAAGGTAAYVAYRVRKNGARPGFKMSRARTKTGRSASRLGSVGKGRGKGPKLLGGKGAKLGGRGKGPKLGKGGPKLGGKSGKLLGGKAGKLGGRAGKLLGGGRGSRLGGKLGSGKKATSRLGSVGKGGGRLLGRGGKAGLGMGKRGGKSVGARLGSVGRKAGGKLGAAALRTKAGRRTAGGFRAAKAALTGKGNGKGQGRWARWNTARKAAASRLGGKNTFTRFLASFAAAFLALFAMGHGRWKTRQGKKAAAAAGQQQATTTTTTTTTTAGPAATTTTTTTTTRALGPGVINPTRIHQRRNMTAFPLAAAAAEMNAAAAAHAPQSMLQVANELDQFGEVPTQVALAVRSYTMRLESDYPIHPAVVEKIQEYAIAEAQLKSIADEIGPLFRMVHAKDLERFEAPRTNEQAWDVTSV